MADSRFQFSQHGKVKKNKTKTPHDRELEYIV